MNYKPILKSLLPHLVVVAVMIIVSSIYFSPAWEGKTLQRHDIVKSVGGNRDRIQAKKYEGKQTLWSVARFCGMPNFLDGSYKSSNLLKKIYSFPQKIGIPGEVSYLAWYMFSLYILLIAFGVNPWLALVGSIAFGLTSYNVIIINAGHFKKVRTLAFIAPTLAGFLLTYRGKYLTGFTLIAFFLAQQIAHDHIQMSYYLLLGMICMGFVELYQHIKEKKIVQFGKSTLVILLAAMLAIAPNYSKLSNLYRYNKQSIRGKSELTLGKDGIKTKSGLDRDYINNWSSGRAEAMMLFAPKVKGGASAPINANRDLLKNVDPRLRNTVGSMNQYWGNQPGSGGPNSAGPVIVFLFVLGLFIVKGPLKKGILISVILFILLSMGRHLPAFTNLFIDYVPLYNKFRTPVSIMAVGVIFISFFAFYSASQIIQKPELLDEQSKIKIGKKPMPLYLLVGFGFMAFLLINIAFPSLFNTYLSDGELDMFASYRAQGAGAQIDPLISSIKELRIQVFRADFFRSFMFSGAVLLSVFLWKKKKIKQYWFIAIVGILAISDVWSITSNYVSKKDFTNRNLVEEEYRLSDIDKQIYAYEMREKPELMDSIKNTIQKFQAKTEVEQEDVQKYIINKNAYYRVYNLTTTSFQENVTSGSHNSIGGYSPAKLRRYQDLIENHIAKGNMQVLNMLNAKYFITNKGLQINQDVLGPAWFVDTILWAGNPDEEIMMLDSFNSAKQIVVNDKFNQAVGSFEPADSTDIIRLESVEADHLTYKASTSGNRIAVFSEIYYPDWTVLVDGEPADYFEVNYTLRAMNIPQGEHKVEFIFSPGYYTKANKISLISYYLILLIVVSLVAYQVYREIKKPNELKLDNANNQ